MSSSSLSLEMSIAQPNEDHARDVMKWRNDPVTRALSFRTEEIPWENFWPNYCHSLVALPDAPPFFLSQEGKRIAFLSFRPTRYALPRRRGCEISLMVDPAFQRKGVGTTALQQGIQWLTQLGYEDLFAEVKRENTVSLHLFRNAQFEEREGDHAGVSIAVFHRNLTSTQLVDRIFVIAEAGSNWVDLSSSSEFGYAKELIEAAAEAGADAIKFQVFRPETLYAPHAGTADYLVATGIKQEMDALFAECAMPPELIPKLAAHCQSQRIQFLASVFSPIDFDLVDPFVPLHKLASYEIGHARLLEKMARSGKPLLLSTGAATEEEIAWAVEKFRIWGGRDLTLLQCTAKYPAPLATMDLWAIPWLQKRFGVSVGLSDHSREVLPAPLGAVALGAKVIEKHFTLDRTLLGPDHAFAIEPQELKQMIAEIRLLEQALGTGWKRVHEEEKELRDFSRRGVQALRDIRKGELFYEGENIAILRPGKQRLGVHSKYVDEILGKPSKRSIKAGDGVQHGDW